MRSRGVDGLERVRCDLLARHNKDCDGRTASACENYLRALRVCPFITKLYMQYLVYRKWILETKDQTKPNDYLD